MAWAFSSTGQSQRLITVRFRVQIPEGPLAAVRVEGQTFGEYIVPWGIRTAVYVLI
jgi:hypothetical protein